MFVIGHPLKFLQGHLDAPCLGAPLMDAGPTPCLEPPAPDAGPGPCLSAPIDAAPEPADAGTTDGMVVPGPCLSAPMDPEPTDPE